MALPAAGTHAASLTHAGAFPLPHRCIVCAGPTDDLVCETCRARIRGEALEHKRETERADRRGSSS
jgi:hypothetical protein